MIYRPWDESMSMNPWNTPSSAQNPDLTSALGNSFTNPTTDWSNYSKFANNNNEGGNEGGNGGGNETKPKEKRKWEMANTAGKVEMVANTFEKGFKTLDMIFGEGGQKILQRNNPSFKDPGTVTADDGSDDDDW